jgi:alkanesulfonate monooxygenase SsuD/methylene tetrahydromethanopterin reductase-like flavin-dependent oxidoreductase (luciferase family)
VEFVIGLSGDPSNVAHEAAELEEIGYDGVGVGDHRSTVHAAHLLTTLGAVAVVTSRRGPRRISPNS